MKCKVCEKKLLEYLYGELDEADRGLMEDHLAESASCMETYQSFQAIRKMAVKSDQEELPAGLHARIMAHATEHKEDKKQTRAWARLFRPVLATAVVAVVAGVIYLQTSRIQGPQQKMHAVLMEESPDQEPKETLVARSFKSEAGYDRLESRDAEQILGAREKKYVRDHVSTEVQVGIPPGAGEDTGEPSGTSSLQVAMNRMQESSMPEFEDGFKAKGAGQVATPGPPPGDATSPERKGFEIPAKAEAPARTSSPFLAARGKPSEEIAQRLDDEAKESRTRPAMSKVMSKAASTTPPPAHEAPEIRLPDPVAKAVDLAKSGRCEDALPHVEAYAAQYPKEPACGPAWMELARCFHQKGDEESARKMALKASEIPVTSREAQTMLQTLRPHSE